MSHPTGRRVLVFRCGHLGDTVIAMPALWSIREYFTEARITYLANGHPGTREVAARAVVPKIGLVDDWMEYDARARVTDIVALVQHLRSRRFTDLVYLMPSRRTRLQRARDLAFFKLAGIGRFWGHRAFERPPVRGRQEGPVRHEADLLLDRLEATGIPAVRRFDLGLTDEERNEAGTWLRRVGVSGEAPIVAVAPGTKAPSKQWPVGRFIEVVARLRRKYGMMPVVVGGKEDESLGEEICGAAGGGAVAAGRLSVRATGALMEYCSLYLGNDTGAMHLAAAAGTRCVVPFSAQDWNGRWSPIGGPHAVLRSEIECQACFLTQCPRGNECLDRIEVDQVEEEAEKLLQSSAGPVAALDAR